MEVTRRDRVSEPPADVVVNRDGHVARLTIDRPGSRNALSRAVQTEIRGYLEDFAVDDDVRALVLTGGGDRVFAAGADVREIRDFDRCDGLAGHLQRLCDAIEQFPKPTIAAVNGYALGGGCELALACDIRIAATHALFGLPETGLGIIPGAGGTQRLSRIVGGGRALEMILTGRHVTAEEALRIGLITQVTEPGELLDSAHKIAQTIASKGPLATHLARLVVRSGLDTDLRTGQMLERFAQAILHEATDKNEGIGAILDKRAPRFEGRR